ncbi:hypothetical protein [Spirosoma panaciterrae]|uniref:hypothetical protein n=1 Tax=Spirosoma panaciterrae TaxID=496058 RepID=UPI000378331D|nr:hypothetical protein [Spirosoma panaciterrae]
MTPKEFATVYLKAEFHQQFLDAVKIGNPRTINQEFGAGPTAHYNLAELKKFIKPEWQKGHKAYNQIPKSK